MFSCKKILITGGTGSWGNELTSQLLEKNPEEINKLEELLRKGGFID